MNFLSNAWSDITGLAGQYFAGRNSADAIRAQVDQANTNAQINMTAAQMRAKQITQLATLAAGTIVLALAIRKGR